MCPLCDDPRATSTPFPQGDYIPWECPKCSRFHLPHDIALKKPLVGLPSIQELARGLVEYGEVPLKVTDVLLERVATGAPLHRYIELTLRVSEIGLVDTITAKLDLMEEGALRAFVREVDAMAACRWVQEGMSSGIHFRFQGSQSVVSAEIPHWEQVQVFLHRARPILLEKEATFLPKIANIVGRRLDHEVVRALMKQYRDMFLLREAAKLYSVTIDELELNSEGFFNLWVNTEEFHRDPAHLKWLKVAESILGKDGVRAFACALLAEKARAALMLADYVEVMLKPGTTTAGVDRQRLVPNKPLPEPPSAATAEVSGPVSAPRPGEGVSQSLPAATEVF